MQLVEKGPDIPNHLMQAHEEGRVVFFCGAGVSYPAGLPGFKGLVTKLYASLGTSPTEIEKSAIRKGQFDTAIGLLEARIPGSRERVREQVAEILTPADVKHPRATATHRALISLARNKDGRHRIVTTNFDRLFEVALIGNDSISRSAAPRLPVPKRRWSGLVYLHGLLPEKPAAGDLDALVLSSGDFGLAYLTEGWAARFVSELFRNYVVCFVGYSINDPVLRYMMDALAADRLLGESPSEVFAFGSFSKGRQKEQELEWDSKHVTPILYEQHSNHFYLHRTLRAWADHYRDGILGNERIVSRNASNPPPASTKQDDVVGRVLWAISDPSGVPAKLFAELDPVPPLAWLEPLARERFFHRDLRRFGIQPNEAEDKRLRFSLLSRYARYDAVRSMNLLSDSRASNSWDNVMHQMARWTLRHLNSPQLLLWFAARGGKIDETLARMISQALNSTSGGPTISPQMRKLWSFLLAGRVR
jgi:SIR2-like domain